MISGQRARIFSRIYRNMSCRGHLDWLSSFCWRSAPKYFYPYIDLLAFCWKRCRQQSTPECLLEKCAKIFLSVYRFIGFLLEEVPPTKHAGMSVGEVRQNISVRVSIFGFLLEDMPPIVVSSASIDFPFEKNNSPSVGVAGGVPGRSGARSC